MAILTSRPPRKCLNPGCPAIGDWVPYGGRCPDHRKQQAKRFRPMERLYATRQYKDRYQPRLKQLNPVCQRIENGVRCTNMSEVLHHLKEATSAAEFFDPKNAAMLCREHHNNAPGTPHWHEGLDYAPTVWNAPSFGQEG